MKLGESAGEIEDDVVIIGRDDHEIEVGQYLYEFIILALPYQRIHPDDDEEFHLQPGDVENWMLTGYRGKINDQTDPRWDALKGIIEKNK